MTKAVAALQEVAGPCYPLLLLKLGAPQWTPVGEEMLSQQVPGKDGTWALVICDADGNSKTMSGWLPRDKAEECSKLLEMKGIAVFTGEVRLPI